MKNNITRQIKRGKLKPTKRPTSLLSLFLRRSFFACIAVVHEVFRTDNLPTMSEQFFCSKLVYFFLLSLGIPLELNGAAQKRIARKTQAETKKQKRNAASKFITIGQFTPCETQNTFYKIHAKIKYYNFSCYSQQTLTELNANPLSESTIPVLF